MRCSCSILLLFGALGLAGGANVLFIAPSVTFSLILHAGRLADLLVEDGHNVTVLILDLIDTQNRNGTRLANVVRMSGLPSAFSDALRNSGDLFDPGWNTFAKRRDCWEGQHIVYEAVLQRSHELLPLKSQNFDVVFTNDLSMSTVALAHWIGAKSHIWIAPGPLHEFNLFAFGVPSPPSYLPVLEDHLAGPHMNIFERFHNLKYYLETVYLYRDVCNRVNKMFRKYAGDDFPDVAKLATESALSFVNDNEFLAMARPILHKTVYIGGLGLRNPQPLQPQFAAIMEKGEAGVVLIAFGTATPTHKMNAEKRRDMIRAFKNLHQYQFLWVIVPADNETAAMAASENAQNIEFVNWAPQTDLLAHPRLKGFVTHGGYNSVMETSMRGVPLIVLPLYFDHFHNGKLVEFRGTGVVIDKVDINQHNFEQALRRILLDPSYALAAKRLKHLIATQPNNPDETFLKWTNFVIENGNLPDLVPVGTQLNFWTYFCLDIIVILLFFLLATFTCLFVLFRCIRTAKTKSKLE